MLTLAAIFVLICAIALVWWGFERLKLPEPVRIIAVVLLGLVALGMAYNFVAGGLRF